MSEVETIVIEGDNVTIANYAFRACPKLKKVIIKGENVVFTGRSMVITNGESACNGIEIYVANDTVAASLKLAQSTLSGYTIKYLSELA